MQKENDARQQRDDLSERQEKLSVARRLLLEKRLRGQLKNKEWTIPRREQSGPAPLSYAQQRLWFLSQLMPDSPFYNVPIITRLRGSLHIALLQQAVDQIVKRHETLRTTFALLEQQPVQVIHPPGTTRLPVVDLCHLPATCRQATAQQLVTQEVKTPFNLTQGPLLRPLLLRLDGDEHILVLNMHHIITDAWSVRVFIDELRTLYAAFLDNHLSPLPELPIQYADFASWQQQWLQGERLDKQLDYWRRKLSGASFILDLPTDYPRPVAQSFRGAAIPFEMPVELSQALKNLSRQTGNNLFNTLLALFNLLLSRYTNQSDILVGIPIAGRHRSEVKGLIGFFVNTLVIRTQLSRHLNVQELLAQIRETTLEAYSNQDLPLELLVKDLLPERDPGRNPLFQVMFDFDEAVEEAATSDDNGLDLDKTAYLTETDLDLETDSGTAKFDLSLAMFDTGQTLRGEIEYSTELFTAATIQNLASHLQQLATEIVSNPQQPLWALSVLTTTESDQIVYAWNETTRPYASSLCIHQL
ncbi:MAG: hypothetical protein KC418_20320, partial [Anaerolineales bacterium]|nr:hypothetical protein [Anaerolineales bacterium]